MTDTRGFLLWMRRPFVGLLLTLLGCLVLLGVVPAPLTDAMDRHLYDGRLQSRVGTPDPQVIIVDIDEPSLAVHGHWPWSRNTMARLLDTLAGAGGAAVVGVDIVFGDFDHDAGADDALARMLRRRPVVLGYYFTSDRAGMERGSLPHPAMRTVPPEARSHGVTSWSGYGANLDALQTEAAGAGFFNSLVDPDGVVRALPMLAEYRGQLYESFALSVLRVWLGESQLRLEENQLLIQGERGLMTLPLSSGLSTLIPYTATRGRDAIPGVQVAGTTSDLAARAATESKARFRYVSAGDVLSGRVDPATFKGRIVLVGTSASGLSDLRATPVRALLPGVELHATMISGALDSASHSVKRRSLASQMVATIAVAIVGIVLSFGLPRLGALGAMMLSAVAAGTIWLTGAVAWSNFDLVVPTTTGLFVVAGCALLNLACGYFIEDRARRMVASAFGQYVSPALVERMMGDPGRYASEASENREITVLFVDICGFTQISETMAPEDLREYINAFLTSMTEVVHRYGGTIDKYIGDAVMAFWGAPVDDPQHADHAVAASLSMLEEVQRLNRGFERRGLPPLRVGIGINTGIARVGDMGSRLRRSYTAIGNTVNLASRLESLTRRFAVPIIVGRETMQQARGHRFVSLGPVEVPSISEPVEVHAPAGIDAVMKNDVLSDKEGASSFVGGRLGEAARSRV